MIKLKNVKKKTPKYYYVAALGIFLFLGVGYSVITTTLEFKGNVTASANKWDIYFENVEYAEDSKKDAEITITNGSQMEYSMSLVNPGEKYEFTFDVTNNGTLDALIKTLSITALTEEQQKYINYSVEYDDGFGIDLDDYLNKKSSRKIHVLVEYKQLKATDLYPEDDINLTMNINLNYYQPKNSTYILTVKSENEEVEGLNASQNTSKSGTVVETKKDNKINSKVRLLEGSAPGDPYDPLDPGDDPIIVEFETIKVEVPNTVQKYTLDTYPDTEFFKAIVCSGKAYATIDESNNITINNIKEDTTCYVEESVKDAIDKYDNSYITVLFDEEAYQSIEIPEGKNIILDLAGKTISSTMGSDIQYITNKGNIVIKDSKTGGTIKADYRVIESEGNMTILGGSYIRENTSTTASEGVTIGISAGTATIQDAYIKSDYTWAVMLTKGAPIINISNSTIESTNKGANIGVYTQAEDGIINLKDSKLIAKGDAKTVDTACQKGVIVSLCRVNVTSASVDFPTIKENTLFYSSNSVFTDGTNTPSSSDNSKNIYKTDAACGE